MIIFIIYNLEFFIDDLMIGWLIKEERKEDTYTYLKVKVEEGEGTEHVNDKLGDLRSGKISSPPNSISKTLQK